MSTHHLVNHLHYVAIAFMTLWHFFFAQLSLCVGEPCTLIKRRDLKTYRKRSLSRKLLGVPHYTNGRSPAWGASNFYINARCRVSTPRPLRRYFNQRHFCSSTALCSYINRCEFKSLQPTPMVPNLYRAATPCREKCIGCRTQQLTHNNLLQDLMTFFKMYF